MNYESGIDVGCGQREVRLDSFSLVELCIYRQTFKSQKAILAEQSEARFESAEYASSFGKEAAKEEVLRKLSNNCAL